MGRAPGNFICNCKSSVKECVPSEANSVSLSRKKMTPYGHRSSGTLACCSCSFCTVSILSSNLHSRQALSLPFCHFQLLLYSLAPSLQQPQIRIYLLLAQVRAFAIKLQPAVLFPKSRVSLDMQQLLLLQVPNSFVISFSSCLLYSYGPEKFLLHPFSPLLALPSSLHVFSSGPPPPIRRLLLQGIAVCLFFIFFPCQLPCLHPTGK